MKCQEITPKRPSKIRTIVKKRQSIYHNKKAVKFTPFG